MEIRKCGNCGNEIFWKLRIVENGNCIIWKMWKMVNWEFLNLGIVDIENY